MNDASVPTPPTGAIRPPLLTEPVHRALLAARAAGVATARCSLDLERTQVDVTIGATRWSAHGVAYPYLDRCRPRTVHAWIDGEFTPVARHGTALVKLVPTEWGPPTFEIDGVKMLPTRARSPLADAEDKVASVEPRGARVLDTCGGLGYFAACALAAGARGVLSFEKNADVVWLRSLNPWSPPAPPVPPGVAPGAAAQSGAAPGLTLVHADVQASIGALGAGAFEVVLHDPPRFALAGELYAEAFYRQLHRVLAPGGRMFHYTGAPNSRSRGRDLPGEVIARLTRVGFRATRRGDGVLALKRGDRPIPIQGRRRPS